MAFPEHPKLDHDTVYEDIQGERVSDDVPRQFAILSPLVARSQKEFKKAVHSPGVREIVDKLQENGMVVAARPRASEIIFTVARHKKAIIASGLAAGGFGAYHVFRKRKKR